MLLSVILPVYNEKESLEMVVKDVLDSFSKNRYKGEVLIVDDGSTDGTSELADRISAKNRNVTVIHHSRNMGKSKALSTGFRASKGDIVIFMDSDLQHTASDIPKFVKAIDSGLDVVNGWRRKRKDPVTKRFPSRIFNFMSNLFFGLKVHDFNCGFKAMKSQVAMELRLKPGEHRYLVAIAKGMGFKVGEVEVEHFPRKFGKSKYSGRRLFGGFLDLLFLKLYLKYSRHPALLFGGLGLLSGFLGVMIGIYLLFLKFLEGATISDRPLLLLSVLLVIMGVQFFFTGFLSSQMVSLKREMEDMK